MNKYHITHDGTNWVMKPEKSTTVVLSNANKETLLSQLDGYFRARGEKASVVIHDHWGRIQEERTYPRSADPWRTPG
jgi:hypothetical protein